MFLEILKKYKNDIILIITMIAISVSSWLIIDALKTEGGYVVVVIDGKESARYSLDVNNEITINNGDNYNILKIEDGVAKIIDASCPDKYCMTQPQISYNNETLTCLPNRVVVKVVSKSEPQDDI